MYFSSQITFFSVVFQLNKQLSTKTNCSTSSPQTSMIGPKILDTKNISSTTKQWMNNALTNFLSSVSPDIPPQSTEFETNESKQSQN